MTKNKAFKQEVRALVQATGRSYADARRIVLAEREADADKAAGRVERYDTDEAFLASFEGPADA